MGSCNRSMCRPKVLHPLYIAAASTNRSVPSFATSRHLRTLPASALPEIDLLNAELLAAFVT